MVQECQSQQMVKDIMLFVSLPSSSAASCVSDCLCSLRLFLGIELFCFGLLMVCVCDWTRMRKTREAVMLCDDW